MSKMSILVWRRFGNHRGITPVGLNNFSGTLAKPCGRITPMLLSIVYLLASVSLV